MAPKEQSKINPGTGYMIASTLQHYRILWHQRDKQYNKLTLWVECVIRNMFPESKNIDSQPNDKCIYFVILLETAAILGFTHQWANCIQ